MTTVLAIRHISFEDLGLYSSVLEEAGASVRYVEAPLQLTDAGQASALHHFDGSKTSVLHWHGDTFDLPEGATRLASTDLCLNQAFSRGESALAPQSHVETMGAALETRFVGHTAEIASHEGVSVASLRADTQHWTPILEPYARQFFREWMTGTGL